MRRDACRDKTTSVFNIQWIIKKLSIPLQYRPPCTKGRDTRCDKSLRHVAATGCCNKSPRVTCENHCRCDRISSLRSVAQIQTGLNSCANRSDKLSASPVPELSFLPAPYRGWTRAGERRVQDNLHAHAHNEPIKDYQVPTKLLASMCRAMPFSARALKENIFFDVDIVIKNILYSYRQRVRVITLFPNIFFVFFLYV